MVQFRGTGGQGMNIVFVGAPGSYKWEVSTGLFEAMNKDDIEFYRLTQDPVLKQVPQATGSLADYREELLLASQRATYGPIINEERTIFTHSLIDSFAYATVRYKFMAEMDSASDDTIFSWWLTVNTIGRIFRDTFKADKVYRVVNLTPSELGHENNNAYFISLLEEAYDAILDTFEIEVNDVVRTSDLLSEEDYATIGKSLLEDINGPRTDNAEPHEQELVQ
jgi:hypothetical protein